MKPPARSRPRKKRELPEPFVWHDTQVLRTYISDRGKIRARRVTGLTRERQRQWPPPPRTPGRGRCVR